MLESSKRKCVSKSALRKGSSSKRHEKRHVRFGTVETRDFGQTVYKGLTDRNAKIRLNNKLIRVTRKRRVSGFEAERERHRREAAQLRFKMGDLGRLLLASGDIIVESPTGFIISERGEVLLGHSGWLLKQSVHATLLANWRRRFFRLRPDGMIMYYLTDDPSEEPRGALQMTPQTRAQRVSFNYFNRHHCLLMTGLLSQREGVGRGFFGGLFGSRRSKPVEIKLALQANSDEDRNRWLQELRRVYQNIVSVEKQKKLQQEAARNAAIKMRNNRSKYIFTENDDSLASLGVTQEVSVLNIDRKEKSINVTPPEVPSLRRRGGGKHMKKETDVTDLDSLSSASSAWTACTPPGISSTNASLREKDVNIQRRNGSPARSYTGSLSPKGSSSPMLRGQRRPSVKVREKAAAAHKRRESQSVNVAVL
eukprot:g728.t1